MQHVVMVTSVHGDTVYRGVSLQALEGALQRRGRAHSVYAAVDAATAVCSVAGSAVFQLGGGGGEGALAALELPDFMFPVRTVEVWRGSNKSGDRTRQRAGPVLENMCGMLRMQVVSGAALQCALPSKRRNFGYSMTIPSLYGNLSFDKRASQPLFRGVSHVARFRKLMERLGVCMDEMYVSLIVFSAHLGRKVCIKPDGPLGRMLPRVTSLRAVYTLDDQNNTLRFSETLQDNPNISMNVVLNRNGGVTARYFTKTCEAFGDDAMAGVQRHLHGLLDVVMRHC